MTNSISSVLEKVERRGEDECWPWTGYLSSGYGRIDIQGMKGVYAHRVAYLCEHPGSIELRDDGTKDQCVLHRCDNPICCNPRHLFIGTHADNMDDKARKGRAPDYSKGKGPRCKLIPEDVLRIREAVLFGARRKDLEQIYGVSNSVIDFVISRRSYADIT